MADKKSVGHAYNVDFLNVVFAASSLFLFLSVVWMVWDDFDRDWKKTQRQFAQLETQVTQLNLQQAGRAVDKSKLSGLEAQEKGAKAKVAANRLSGNISELTDTARRFFDELAPPPVQLPLVPAPAPEVTAGLPIGLVPRPEQLLPPA